MNRSRLAALSAGAMFLVASVLAPAAALADTGNTNTIKVLPATTTISPVGTGSSFTVNIVANGSTDISGAGAALSFDNTKLTLTAIAKTLVPVDAGSPPAYVGFPSAANLATFLSNANTNGYVPNISWAYQDGASSEPGNAGEGIFSATFSVTATGDNTLALDTGVNGVSMIGGVPGLGGNYGDALPVTPFDGTVVNHFAPVFSISAPGTASVNRGATTDVTVSTAVVSGTPGNIALSTGSLPTGVTASFSPNPVPAGSSSTLTFSATGSATTGTFPVTVTGIDSADATDTHSTTINLTVVAPNDFSISATPGSVTVTAGNTGTTSVSVTEITPTAGAVNLSVTSVLPSGVTASFTPTSAAVGAPSTLTFTTTAAATTGSHAVTVTGDNGTNTHTTNVTLVVNGLPPANAQDVNVTGTMDGGFIGLTCPTSVAIPLVRGNTNQVNVPCAVYTNTVWNLNANDAATDAFKGHLVTGRPVDNTTNFALANSLHVLSGASIVAGETVYAIDVNLVTGGSAATGTNSANVPLVLSQFVAAGDRAGDYGIHVLFSAVSVF